VPTPLMITTRMWAVVNESDGEGLVDILIDLC
jgi:hypothetical protein